jgi:hypothetical protein
MVEFTYILIIYTNLVITNLALIVWCSKFEDLSTVVLYIYIMRPIICPQ